MRNAMSLCDPRLCVSVFVGFSSRYCGAREGKERAAAGCGPTWRVFVRRDDFDVDDYQVYIIRQRSSDNDGCSKIRWRHGNLFFLSGQVRSRQVRHREEEHELGSLTLICVVYWWWCPFYRRS